MKKRKSIILSLLFVFLLVSSCIEEFSPGTLSFKDAIVIEGTITNELKQQKILISRTFKFEEDFLAESNANVVVTSSTNEEFIFLESKPGEYLSERPFKAELNKEYTLSVITQDEKQYLSKTTTLTQSTSKIENVYAKREFNTDGSEGISIYVDSFDSVGNSIYYGYELEQTYQIIAPFWTNDEIVIVSETPLVLQVAPRTKEERVCYATNFSNGRLLTSTTQLSEDRVSDFLVSFIPLDDISLSSRNSILIKQFTQSKESYEYIKILNEFSSVESLLSQIQTGFINGNISNIDDESELVVGFFEVLAVTDYRLFFSREDFIEEFFSWNCSTIVYSPFEVVSEVKNNNVKLLSQLFGEGGISYEVVPRICGDCTRLGSNIRPDFWED
jgi:hypothetical protein